MQMFDKKGRPVRCDEIELLAPTPNTAQEARIRKRTKMPVREGGPLTNVQIERLQEISRVSYGKLKQMQQFGTLYQFCKERGITEL